ncbi:ornithine carbamoyltransferase [Planctomicrobium piriforme]|uniref:Ornithine carbamoyltransferase n=1 Tax=Planctomicrobium piriforme TaxID=1576369 RepID=A0A1I3RKV5_9PLAN|nr:ornithine carbamoyltransferase [Planctomicrobium piriforme]SFJ45951.1 ornithine carbamoyltransferase [Planctomicrobium piriforme]
MRHLTTLLDLTSDEVRDVLKLSARLKARSRKGKRPSLCENKVLTQVFEKPSLRTRVSFEAAMSQLGGKSIFLTSKEAGFDGRETKEDIARVLGGYSDVITLRTFSQELIETFRKHAGCPIINALSDDYHPCQALADIMTVEEVSGSVSGKTIVYVGDGNNVARSLAVICGHMGCNFRIAAPRGYELSAEFLAQLADRFPDLEVEQFHSAPKAVAGADVIYTDVWASMGQESEKDHRSKVFADYQVTTKLLDVAGPNVLFMHCLPARRGQEVDDAVMDDPRSIVFVQAENRMHLAKGLIVWLLEHVNDKPSLSKPRRTPKRKKARGK